MAETSNQPPPPEPPVIPPTISAPPPSPPPPRNPESEARTWNMLCHISALAGFIGVPFGNILGPLLVWQIQKDKYPSVIEHGKEALNFQITMTIALLVGVAAVFVGVFFCVGYFLIPVVAIIPLLGLVFAVIAGIKASNGEDYTYPFSIEFVK
jgi:uncharacterized Tic20 family protein